MRLNPAVRDALMELDVAKMRKLDRELYPHLPPPGGNRKIILMMHVARTAARAIPRNKREYSHAWLTERGWGHLSQLPDRMRPAKEQMGPPRIVEGIGIAVGGSDPEIVRSIQRVMEHAAMGALADGEKDPLRIRARMLDARRRERRALGLGRPPSLSFRL